MLKYMEIAEQIKQTIIENDLAQGTKLPKVSELIQEYQVSKSTIVKALNVLERNGIVYQIQGSGIFVRRNTRVGYVNIIQNKGFTESLDQFEITTKVLLLEKILPTEEIYTHLNCSPDEKVYHVKRLRYINEQVLCVEESYYNCAVVPYLNEEIATKSIFNYLKTALKLNVSFSDKYLHVIKLSETDSQILGLAKDDPALLTEELFYLSSGIPFNFSRTTYHYEHSQFFLQTNNLSV
ncbi:GntR family transcriptional regulator [Enterococcus saccharolyticus]|uniref:GntR family transcriptional regulator n=1 Tax=Candidatus Enterococcus willemsii TaxID=1857215 RepID=A0ABQ6Z2B2_9ENTE|nr:MULTISPECIES: GntR family transcriptional regulator [Enterococcus]KAF1305748.1 GntR family transcriptional regulator [Enterococcus sp. CU12B]MCD5001508.1 GntR family transcriptional regulator [Enterococcus saccharolyticus]